MTKTKTKADSKLAPIREHVCPECGIARPLRRPIGSAYVARRCVQCHRAQLGRGLTMYAHRCVECGAERKSPVRTTSSVAPKLCRECHIRRQSAAIHCLFRKKAATG